MKLSDIVPNIDVNDDWGRNHSYFVPQFINYAQNKIPIQEWNEEVRDQLFRSVNCISSLKMGNFRIIERELIQQNWKEFIEPLSIIASNQNRFCKEESYQVLRTIKQLINANRPAASLRLVAAFQPAQLTTTVAGYYLDKIYGLLKDSGVELPTNYGGDPIERSHYLQQVLRDSYPEVSHVELGTYAWRLLYILPNIKSPIVIISSNTQSSDCICQEEGISATESVVTADVWNTNQLFEEKNNLKIPPYQRPYVWGRTNVVQMLNDIAHNMEQGIHRYRIGSIILHQSKNDDPCEIVDGQQRITTLCLIKRAIYENCGSTMPKLEYNHQCSWEHISENYQIIKDWLGKISSDKLDKFAKYLDEKCEYVVIKIQGPKSLSLAFKVFDSQNGRGKILEAYNLLKAYHIRAMSNTDETIKIECDRNWENSVYYPRTLDGITYSYDILKHLFDEQLYRTRVWSRNTIAWSFSKKHIDEFKGMQIDKVHTADFPFQNKQLLLFMTRKFYQSFLNETLSTCSRFTNGDGKGINPFVSMNDPIVNGEAFFSYIQSYSEIYKRLFIELDSYQLYEFKDFYKKNCLNYKGHWRIGDNYIREMYKSMIMLLFDRFGENGVNEYYKYLYVLAYSIRIKYQRITYQTIAKYPMDIFAILANAKDFASLHQIVEKAATLDLENKYKFSNFDEVYKTLFNNK